MNLTIQGKYTYKHTFGGRPKLTKDRLSGSTGDSVRFTGC